MHRFFSLMTAATLLVGVSSPAFADVCSDVETAPLRLVTWSAEKKGEATTVYSLSLTSQFPKPTRMISGYVTFEDALDENMGAFKLPRDYSAPANTAFEMTVPVGSMVIERVLKIKKDDISARVCVDGVIYEDGTKEEFK
ncbi:hypothetical protein [Rhizobium sp. Root483D2]|uniref:hypothetical protein n=1 Tax=Rhizobium sp. Root483D2 TaxID=1736545 RepID=UPI0007160DF2|nr:hypothetical protein [Rhizobium sp. Root483D2]KQY20226.1 hypothetical protein ASD32_07105 [Rhizobium sp. Root483D2]